MCKLNYVDGRRLSGEWFCECEVRDLLDNLKNYESSMNILKGERRRVIEQIRGEQRDILAEKILPLVQKFISKVESGKARSVETYADMKVIRDFLQEGNKNHEASK